MHFDEPAWYELPVESDEQAHRRLPPVALAQRAYSSYRQQGFPPAQALEQTLALWRELCADARPPGFGQSQCANNGQSPQADNRRDQ